jgi:hypothetical protein
MIEPGTPVATMIGRWGGASSLVVGAVLLGRIIRDMPYLLPNRLLGLVLYELGPGLLLAAAIGSAVSITRGRFRARTRLFAFVALAGLVGTIGITMAFAASLGGGWIWPE